MVAASIEEWISRPVSKIPVLEPMLKAQHWDGEAVGLTSDWQAIVVPVQIEMRSLSEEHGNSYKAVIVLDGTVVATHTRDVMTTLLSIGAVSGALLFLSFFAILRRNILKPLGKIHAAVSSTNVGDRLAINNLYPDEIGHLGDVLRTSYREISA